MTAAIIEIVTEQLSFFEHNRTIFLTGFLY